MKNLLLPILAIAALPLIPTDAAAQISLYDADGNVIFSSKETPAYVDFNYNAPTKGEENGHAWVDLGLPSGTLWATCNIGATKPWEYGDHYAWGEIQIKESYDWSTYKWMNHDVNNKYGCAKYQIADNKTEGVWYDSDGNFIGDGKTELDHSDDAAAQTWGGKWQMPTAAMLNELINQCYWIWTTTYNGQNVNGFVVYKAKSDTDKGVKVYEGATSSSDYNESKDTHIFLPAVGYGGDTGIKNAGCVGGYWSCSLSESDSVCAYNLGFTTSYLDRYDYYLRSNGYSVRPVVPFSK